jgi:hypothetical protein
VCTVEYFVDGRKRKERTGGARQTKKTELDYQAIQHSGQQQGTVWCERIREKERVEEKTAELKIYHFLACGYLSVGR